MDGLTLLQKAREAGLTVSTKGTKLVIRGPRRSESVARLLLQHKPIVMAALGRPCPAPERVGWGAADWMRFYSQRTAVLEHGGQRPHTEVERLAWGETLVAWHRAHGEPPPRALCAGCGEPLSGAASMDIWDGARVHDAPGYSCLIAYGRRWRAAATTSLAALGITAPRESQ